jgi:hypothetical protein
MDAPSSAWFWILLSLSLVGTALCWIRVVRSEDSAFFKVVGLVVSAIPFLGPFLFLFLDMPPRIPEEARAKWEWRLGTTLYTDIRRQLFQGNRRYVASMLGTREARGAGNREWRRATGKAHKDDRDGN